MYERERERETSLKLILTFFLAFSHIGHAFPSWQVVPKGILQIPHSLPCSNTIPHHYNMKRLAKMVDWFHSNWVLSWGKYTFWGWGVCLYILPPNTYYRITNSPDSVDSGFTYKKSKKKDKTDNSPKPSRASTNTSVQMLLATLFSTNQPLINWI